VNYYDETNVTLVFDKGIISDENAALIEEAEMKYIAELSRTRSNAERSSVIRPSSARAPCWADAERRRIRRGLCSAQLGIR